MIESVGNDANKYMCSSVGPQMLSLSSLSRIGHTFVHSFEARRAEAPTDGGGRWGAGASTKAWHFHRTNAALFLCHFRAGFALHEPGSLVRIPFGYCWLEGDNEDNSYDR